MKLPSNTNYLRVSKLRSSNNL